MEKNKLNTKVPVKEILKLLGKGVLLSSLFIFPQAVIGFGPILKVYDAIKRRKDLQEWEKFNLSRLKFNLNRLYKQKLISVKERDGFSEIVLTNKGKRKVLKYNLDEITIIVPQNWDRKWRLIIYDITKFKHRQQSAFRRMLKKLHILQLQKSVYLTPYPCEKEVEFLREYFNVGEGVLYIVVEKLENEQVYKKYFGL